MLTNFRSVIQVVVGMIFIQEGILKFLIPELGYERFLQTSLPYPATVASLVGGIEIMAGTMLLINLQVFVAAFSLLFVMSGALLFTKVPLIFTSGVAMTLHQSRLDFLLCVLLVFILVSSTKRYKKNSLNPFTE